MATKKAPADKSKKRKFMERAGIAVLKGSGSATIGATVGVVEEAVGEKAANGAKAAFAVAGLAAEVFLDPEENPILSEVGKASLHSATAISGYEAAKALTRKGLEAREIANTKKMRDSLMKDMEQEAPTEAAKEKVEVPKKGAKPKSN